MIHHYGSSLNAIPVLAEYRDKPDTVYLLRIGYGGMMGTLSNIDQDGFPSMAFHTFPDTLKWDPITGDVGLNIFGHTYNSATYLVNHPDFGWQAFGGNLTTNGNTLSVTPLDSLRKRFYIAAAGLWLTLDAGQLQKVDFDSSTHAVTVTLTPQLRITSPARAISEDVAGGDRLAGRDDLGWFRASGRDRQAAPDDPPPPRALMLSPVSATSARV